MTRCAVHGCKSGTFSNNLCNVQNNIRPPTLFTVPKSSTALAKWNAALNQDLDPKARVCELHFVDADVKRSDDTLLPDGSIFRLPRLKFRLCKNAVPKNLVIQENKTLENNQIWDENISIEEEISSDEINDDYHKINPTPSNRLQLDTTSLETDEMVTDCEIGMDTSLNDHQYYIDINKPGQYCYYNKKVAACFTIPSLGDDFQKISEKKHKYLIKTCVAGNGTENIEQETTQKNLENQLKNAPSILLYGERNSLTIENIIDYLTKSPIRRSWSWMKFTKKDMGITFTQIHFRTRKVRCYIELYEDLSAMIQTGDEQLSLEIEFEITSIDHILDLLATVEKMKICSGTGYEHESRDKNCNGVIPSDQEYKITTLRERCIGCRNLRKQLRVREKYSKADIKTKYEKVRKELEVLRRKCKYYEGRLNLKNQRLKFIKEIIKSHNKNYKNMCRFKENSIDL